MRMVYLECVTKKTVVSAIEISASGQKEPNDRAQSLFAVTQQGVTT